ncbi:MAG: S9 family peptidase [Propionibacteriaceae bacterium]
MRPEDLELIYQLGTPQVHPSGQWAVVSAIRPDFSSDAYTGQLWQIWLDGRYEPRRLTRGFRDTAPRFSADGSLLAFLRAEQGKVAQLMVMSATGSEPVALSDQPAGVLDFDWSADGRQIAFTARVRQEGRYQTREGIDADSEDPRHITELQFHANGLGYTADQRSNLFVVEVPDIFSEPLIVPVGRASNSEIPVSLVPEAKKLSQVAADVIQPCFSPDGKAIFAVAALHDSADQDLITDIWSWPVAGGAPTRLTNQTMTSLHPVVNNKNIAFLGTDMGTSGIDFIGQNPSVWQIPIDGGKPQLLTSTQTAHMSTVVACEQGFLAVEDYRGLSRIHRLTTDSDEIIGGGVLVTAVAAVPNSSDVIAAVATPTSAGDLILISGEKQQVITDFSATLREHTSLVESQELVATAPDGYPIHGWVLTPAGSGPHPTLLCIHGGPFAAYTGAFFDEFQVYVAAGYAVVACNPRGALGYGEDHGKAIKNDLGNLDYQDVMAFLDHALATNPTLDRDRLGIQGGSYGGYMTAWVIAHDHRFKGAIVERGFLDPTSFPGASDIGWFFQQEYLSRDRAFTDSRSPMALVDQVKTPTLVIHSEKDLRCPISQGYRYFTELKLKGIESELLVFPGENHELTRSGRPWHRRQRFEAILQWWSQHLSK